MCGVHTNLPKLEQKNFQPNCLLNWRYLWHMRSLRWLLLCVDSQTTQWSFELAVSLFSTHVEST